MENQPLSSPDFARHTYLAANDLPQRWQGQDRFVIADTEFGTGLNFLVAWQAWQADPQRCRRLHFIAAQSQPPSRTALAEQQAAWPEFADLANQLQADWPPATPGMHRLQLAGGQIILTLIFGPSADAWRAVDASVNAFFLSNASPAVLAESCRALARLAAPAATLSAPVSDDRLLAALKAVEFAVEPRPGHDNHGLLLRGDFRSRRPDRHPGPAERRAIVIGAGIAGSTTAHALAAAGWQVTVLEQANAPATGASGNLAGVLRPLPSADDNRLSRLTRAGYLATRALLAHLPGARWSPCGVLHLGREPLHEAQQQRAVEQLGWPVEMLQFIDRAAASEKLGWPVDTGGWWFPNGGWVQPGSLCRAALGAFPERITLRTTAAVDRLHWAKNEWQALAANGSLLATAPVLIMASGAAAPGFAQFAWLPQRAARGQVSLLPAAATPPLDYVLCKLGYAMPDIDGQRLIGATLQTGDAEANPRLIDHQENLARLNLSLPGFAANIDPASLAGRVGFRPMSPDRLPIVGAVPDPIAAAANSRLHNLPRQPGLWCVQGFGARGIVWSALMADLLVSRLEGEPLPLENDLVDACDPGRFLLKTARQRIDAADETT